MKLGKIFGISVELHSTFVLLFVIMVALLVVMDPGQLVPTVAVLAILFLTVFVHELFHSIVAISKGTKVSKIILLPIGGISVADEFPENPRDEFMIAIAGPLFNFVMVILIALIVKFVPSAPWPYFLFNSTITAESLNYAIMGYPLFALFWVNLLLGSFNLFLPALPMDGGRVFRAILAGRIGFFRATKLAAKLSTVIAALLFMIGFLIGDLIVLIIAIFIYLGASQERDVAILKEMAKGLDLSRAVNTKPFIVDGEMTLQDIADDMKERKETAFIVYTKRGYGLITSDDIAAAKKDGLNREVSEVCQPAEIIPINRKERIITAIIAKRLPLIGVSENGYFIGTISEAEINKIYALSKLDKDI